MNDAQMNPSLYGAVDLSGLVRKNLAPTAAPVASDALVREIDDASIGDLVELSRTVPVILEVYGGELTPQLGTLIESYQGRFVLGTVRGEAAPELVRALQIQGVPTVLALVGGQPVPLFQGIPPEPEIRQVLDQVLELAAKSGVNGSLTPVAGESLDEAAEPPLPPLHQEAFDALVRNDLAGAKSAYERQLAQTPGDTEAEAGLAQVLLLERVSDLDPAAVREAAAQDPSSVEAALNIADLDISGGHVEDACFRLLTLYPTLDEAGKEIVRTRLLSYFVVAGPTTDAVKRARNQLSSLMF